LPISELIESKEDIRPEVLTLPALDLDKLFQIKFNLLPPSGGHDVPRLSCSPQFLLAKYQFIWYNFVLI
jgi:hypothetical protein